MALKDEMKANEYIVILKDDDEKVRVPISGRGLQFMKAGALAAKQHKEKTGRVATIIDILPDRECDDIVQL